ncbi:hypothetical protein LDG_6229 [Legionella drancourtii LLAP12]|uniref:Uncharacterized protein n=1 Tax=Legionella drancourtii LLAP12 TaxID=658187 RepID=G9ELW9_9GAMM|nr:hypothetical protein LDG_6229 [Legionella drancourtii LLAP12]
MILFTISFELVLAAIFTTQSVRVLTKSIVHLCAFVLLMLFVVFYFSIARGFRKKSMKKPLNG